MKWTENAIDDLQKYAGLKASLDNISERIEMLELEFSGVKGNRMDRERVSGNSGIRWEDILIDNIDKRERLNQLLMLKEKEVSIIDKGLSALNEYERLTLEYFFINRPPNHVNRLAEKLNIERSELYRIKDKAVRKFVLYMYGVEEFYNEKAAGVK